MNLFKSIFRLISNFLFMFIYTACIAACVNRKGHIVVFSYCRMLC